MSQVKIFFSKDLGKKILYKTPLISLDVNLREKITGGDETNGLTYQKFIANNVVRMSFAIHKYISNAVLLLRSIYKTHSLSLDKSRFKLVANDPLDDEARDVLGDYKIMTVLPDKKITIPKERPIIVKYHEVEEERFILTWYLLLKLLGLVNDFSIDNLKKIPTMIKGKTYMPIVETDINPLYYKYVLLE